MNTLGKKKVGQEKIRISVDINVFATFVRERWVCGIIINEKKLITFNSFYSFPILLN